MALRPALLSSAILLAACGASAPSGAEAQSAGITDEEFDRRLREALIRNPEVIIEAIEAYQANLEVEAAAATRQAVAGLMPQLISADAGHAIGASADNAELVLVEFFDYHCGYCRRAMDDVLALTAGDSSVRVVFQELPILREESRKAAEIAVAAARVDPEGYRKAHAALMEAGGLLDEAAIEKAIERAGLKPKEVAEAREAYSDAIEGTIERSIGMAQEIGIQGTPFFVAANLKTGSIEILEGYRPEDFSALLKSVRPDG